MNSIPSSTAAGGIHRPSPSISATSSATSGTDTAGSFADVLKQKNAPPVDHPSGTAAQAYRAKPVERARSHQRREDVKRAPRDGDNGTDAPILLAATPTQAAPPVSPVVLLGSAEAPGDGSTDSSNAEPANGGLATQQPATLQFGADLLGTQPQLNTSAASAPDANASAAGEPSVSPTDLPAQPTQPHSAIASSSNPTTPPVFASLLNGSTAPMPEVSTMALAPSSSAEVAQSANRTEPAPSKSRPSFKPGTSAMPDRLTPSPSSTPAAPSGSSLHAAIPVPSQVVNLLHTPSQGRDAASRGEQKSHSRDAADPQDSSSGDTQSTATVSAPLPASAGLQATSTATVAQIQPSTIAPTAAQQPIASASQSNDLPDPVPAAIAAGSAASPLNRIDAAHLLRTSRGSELRVGLQSDDFGAITIRTSLGREHLATQISVESGPLSSALQAHLSSMQTSLETRLGEGLGVRASVTLGEGGASTATGNGAHAGGQGSASGDLGSSGGSGRRQPDAYARSTSRFSTDHSSITASNAASLLTPNTLPAERGRLDIRI